MYLHPAARQIIEPEPSSRRKTSAGCSLLLENVEFVVMNRGTRTCTVSFRLTTSVTTLSCDLDTCVGIVTFSCFEVKIGLTVSAIRQHGFLGTVRFSFAHPSQIE